MTLFWYDCETYSEVPISHGVDPYAEKAEQMIHAYAFDDGPVSIWDETDGSEMPADLEAAFRNPEYLVVSHNSRFDRTLLAHCYPELCPPVERWLDTMVMALSHSLPASLAHLCQVLKVPTDQAKDRDGKRLIQLFCKPRPSNMKLRRATSESHPIEWAKFVAYAGQDIVAMRECYRRLPKWNVTKDELALWHLDQKINDRGFCVDLELARAAVKATEREQQILADQTKEMTSGVVESATQREALINYLFHFHGITVPNLQKATIEKMLTNADLPREVIDLLQVRQQASGTASAKYQVLLNATSTDGRLRGTLQFRGASRTGRWSGRLFQPQNLPRSTMKQSDIEDGITALKANILDLI